MQNPIKDPSVAIHNAEDGQQGAGSALALASARTAPTAALPLSLQKPASASKALEKNSRSATKPSRLAGLFELLSVLR